MPSMSFPPKMKFLDETLALLPRGAIDRLKFMQAPDPGNVDAI
jgi:hypothetical protein